MLRQQKHFYLSAELKVNQSCTFGVCLANKSRPGSLFCACLAANCTRADGEHVFPLLYDKEGYISIALFFISAVKVSDVSVTQWSRQRSDVHSLHSWTKIREILLQRGWNRSDFTAL